MIWSTGCFIFGLFNDKPWKSSGEYFNYETSLLFSFNITSNEHVLTKMRITRNKCYSAILHRYSFGPFFINGPDLFILIVANNSIKSHFNIGNSYEAPPGKTNLFWLNPTISKCKILSCSETFYNSYCDVASLRHIIIA